MGKSNILHLLISATVVAALIFSTIADTSGEKFSWTPMKNKTTCQGTITECMADGIGEFEMDTEINRRILATGDYISYGALERNRVICSVSGAPYSDCTPSAVANPNSGRGCSVSTGCRS